MYILYYIYSSSSTKIIYIYSAFHLLLVAFTSYIYRRLIWPTKYLLLILETNFSLQISPSPWEKFQHRIYLALTSMLSSIMRIFLVNALVLLGLEVRWLYDQFLVGS